MGGGKYLIVAEVSVINEPLHRRPLNDVREVLAETEAVQPLRSRRQSHMVSVSVSVPNLRPTFRGDVMAIMNKYPVCKIVVISFDF